MINNWLRKTRSVYNCGDGIVFDVNRPRIVCKDGDSVSVQASGVHYCKHRVDGEDKYESVERGFPNREDPLINDYAEDDGDLTRTVYGYVPVEVVNELIEKHGGIVE